ATAREPCFAAPEPDVIRSRFEMMPASTGPAPAASRAFGDEAVAHPAQSFDLGLHDVARLQEGVGPLADAAAGAAAEDIARLKRQDVGGEFDLLLRREDELRRVAVLLDLAVHGEADEQVHLVGNEGARHEERAHRGEAVVALAA